MKKKIIGFTGKKGSGKSEACKFFAEIKAVERINFKDALLAEIKQYFPDVLEKLSSIYMNATPEELFQNKPPIVRAFLQNFGTELRRAEDSQYWTKKWVAAVRKSQTKIILTDDVRFLNEEEAVRKMNGTIIRIIRPSVRRTTGDRHASESEMDGITPDFTVTADSVLELRAKLNELHLNL